MEVFINGKDLERLYTSGISKKLRLPEQVVEKFFAAIQKIDAAENIFDLRNDRGLHFEKLKGFSNRYSMRLSLKYRLETEISWLNDEQTVGEFHIDKISVHYSK